MKLFRGKDADISVAMQRRCDALTVLAAFHGPRREVGLVRPAYYSFRRSDLVCAGGRLQKTSAQPPWPDEYDQAHHDVVANQQAVAERMAELFEEDPSRVKEVEEVEVLCRIAQLLSRPDVHSRFAKNAKWRFRRMFADGKRERRLWVAVARRERILLDDDAIIKDFRKLYANTATRSRWQALMKELAVDDTSGYR